ncbi:TonB-dependent receptor [Stenotrophomonas sp. YIM B06876]|uniref:TonB-dependent receptor domain-containing protein n=1 Tax=Stenotrophomonas sp. YIM B06876 TaxID=3060211 RepID=UPI0027382E23|nr:TonB-dependent receptor [Stenotrophomonas sp. YIM B06876]
MNHQSNKLRDAVIIALVTSAGTSGAAFAQEASAPTSLDRIEVTGSRIRQVDLETAQPVLTISRQDIESQGFSSVADILQNISAAGSPSFSRASPLTSNQEAGGQYIDLRNLGAQRTLVLVNGKRLGISPNGYQDVSSIPSVIVERIEVLKDGASSIYGSDAMAGVINIITRKNFEGAQANAYVGQYSQGDGQKQSYDFLVGFKGDRGSVTVGAEYHKEEGVWAKDRWFSEDTRPGDPLSGLTTVGQWGNYNTNNNQFARDKNGKLVLDSKGNPTRLGATWAAPNRGSNAMGSGNFHPQDPIADTSRSSDQMHLLTPLKRRSLFVNASYDIFDNVRFNADMGYTKRDSNRQIAGYPTQSTAIGAPMAGAVYRTNADGTRTFVSNGSYFNPNGNADLYQADVAGYLDPKTGLPAFSQTNNIDWRRRGWEVPRTTDTSLTTWRFTAALEGSFEIGDRYFDWDAGYLFNENESTIINNGNFYIPAVQAAVGPSFKNSAGQIQCGTAANPIALTSCVPWNPFAGFGTGAVANSLDDPAVRKYLFREEHAVGNTKTNSYFANIAGSLFALPAGDLAFALGYEYRKEQGGFFPDAIAQSGNSTNLASGPTSGGYSLDELYAELNIPVLADVAFAKELTLSVASRYSDYNTFGDTTNNKFGLKWRPTDELLVRATWSEGFRAPTIGNLYGGGSQSFTTGFEDPCDSVYGVAKGSAKCLADVGAGYRQLKQGFVPTTQKGDQTPVPFTSGSNPNLQPENSESKTIGFVYSPGYVQGLSVAVDWWNIRIDNTMVSDSPNLIMEDCYVGLIASRCANFTRDPVTKIVNDLKYGLRNAGFTETEGFDFDVNYAQETGFGRFGAKWATTYVSKYESKATNDPATVPNHWNGRNAYFRIRSNLSLTWKLENWSAMWGMRYFSGSKENCSYLDRCTTPNWAAPETLGKISPKNNLGSNTFHDVQVAWSAPWDARIAVGANNVFNHISAPWYSQASSNFAYYGGFDIGRTVYLKYQQNF